MQYYSAPPAWCWRGFCVWGYGAGAGLAGRVVDGLAASALRSASRPASTSLRNTSDRLRILCAKPQSSISSTSDGVMTTWTRTDLFSFDIDATLPPGSGLLNVFDLLPVKR